jgi:ribosomal protein L40E
MGFMDKPLSTCLAEHAVAVAELGHQKALMLKVCRNCTSISAYSPPREQIVCRTCGVNADITEIDNVLRPANV